MIEPHTLRQRLTVIGELARSGVNLNYATALRNLLTITADQSTTGATPAPQMSKTHPTPEITDDPKACG